MNSFFELVQMAVGCRESISEPPASREEWEELLKVTGKHNLLGVTFPAIDELHDSIEIPLSIYSRWAMMAEKIAKRNEVQTDCETIEVTNISSAQWRPTVLETAC